MKTVLVSAYACEPSKGSEPGVGWNWIILLSRNYNLHVVTRKNNSDSIDLFLSNNFLPNVTFHYIDGGPVLLRVKRYYLGFYIYYIIWQFFAYNRARKIVKSTTIDAICHLTFGNIWLPTFLVFLNKPFILGPMGGGEAVPWSFIKTLAISDRIAQYFRYLLIYSAWLNPLLIYTLNKTVLIIARTPDTARVVPRRYAHKVRILIETELPPEIISRLGNNRPNSVNQTLRIVYTGRLVAFKNVSSSILAIAKARALGVFCSFRIVGDGPDREALELLVRRLSLTEHIKFVGAVSRADLLEELLSADVFLFLSLREAGTWSLMEAMAAQLAVVCIATSGMKVLTDGDSAIRLDPVNPTQIIEDAAQAIYRLSADRDLLQSLGICGRRKILRDFYGDSRRNQILRLFGEVLG